MQWSLILLFLMGQCCFITCQLHQYHFVEERKTWTEAQKFCKEKYSDLATVSNMPDMKRILTKSSGNMNEAWIGLTNEAGVNRTWYWSLPGVEFNETKWKTGEPTDNETTGAENCGITFKDLLWGDHSCGPKKSFLCYDEKNASHKFHYIKQSKTWLEAQSYCREKHTDLISGLNQTQDEQLKTELSSAGSGTFIYIGLFRDTWRWSDGNSSSFRHWNLQFDNTNFKSDQCAATVFNDGGRWKTDSCTKTKPFFCYSDKFILIPENKTWEEALYYCRENYYDLVTITNLDEQRWVQEKAKNASTPFVWTGLRYTCTLDFWFWVSDEVVSYKHWDSDGQMDDCDMSGAMETGGQHKWFKRNDNEEFNFICS